MASTTTTTASNVFKGALFHEGQNLLELFRNTLAFTVSLNAVQSLVADRDESALLFAVGVASLLFIVLASEHVLKTVQYEEESALTAIQELVLFLLRQTSVIIVQFESNLFAHILRTVFITAISTGWVIAFRCCRIGAFSCRIHCVKKETIKRKKRGFFFYINAETPALN